MKKLSGLLFVFSIMALNVSAGEKEQTKVEVMNDIVTATVTTAIVLPSHPVVLRYSGSKNDTLGLFFIDQVFQHYMIEDEFRADKVKGETRIPAGIYPLSLKEYGGFHQRYAKKFSDIHEGMVKLNNVPNFSEILYHIMNKDEDTEGCIGGGDTANNNQIGKGFVGNSTQAYKRTYPKLLAYIKSTDKPVIEIVDLDRV